MRNIIPNTAQTTIISVSCACTAWQWFLISTFDGQVPHNYGYAIILNRHKPIYLKSLIAIIQLYITKLISVSSEHSSSRADNKQHIDTSSAMKS